MLPKSLIAPRETSSQKRGLVKGVGAGRLNVNGVLLYGPINSPYRIRTIMDHVRAQLQVTAEKETRKTFQVCRIISMNLSRWFA